MPPPQSLLMDPKETKKQVEPFKSKEVNQPPQVKAPEPKLKLPEVSLPKVTLPKVPKIESPKPPKFETPSPPKSETNVIFSEVSLKKLIAVDKTKNKEVSAQAGAKRQDATKIASEENTRAEQEAKKRALEEKKAEEEERKREASAAKKASALKAAVAKKQAAEARQLAAEERERVANEKKMETEKKRAEAQAAAEERKRVADEKRVASLAAAEARKNKTVAKESVEKAQPGATISLGFFGFGKKTDGETSEQVAAPRKVSSAPRGVPAISKWRQNRDGSISGQIFGSTSFKEGESITTSPIASDAISGTVVQTTSGSK